MLHRIYFEKNNELIKKIIIELRCDGFYKKNSSLIHKHSLKMHSKKKIIK